MSNKKNREAFEELTLPRKDLPKLLNHYRVYKAPGDYIRVEADSALEAFKKCGFQQAYRIERDTIYLANVLNLEALSSQPAPAAKAVAETPAASVAADATAASVAAPAVPEAAPAAGPPAAEAPAAVAPAAEAPLSNDDVDKLLKGENATGA